MMKTSDKLLGLFFILVLCVPLSLSLSFRKSIREGKYERITFDHRTLKRGNYLPYKTVKIIAPVPDVLRCFLLPTTSDSLRYSYTKYYSSGPDNVRVYNSGDTLYVRYLGGKANAEYRDGQQISPGIKYTRIDVNLHLSSFDDIVVDMGTVVIDSLGKPATISLVNLGSLNLATSGERRVKFKPSETDKNVAVPVDSTFSGDFSKLNITANNGRIAIGGNAWIRDINFDLKGPSKLFINDYSRIDRISGKISGSTSITAPKDISKLEALISKEE